MLFVPIVVPHRPSPRAQELAKRLNEAIDQYSILHPDLRPEEIRQAAMLATAKCDQQRRVVLASLAVALVLVAALIGAVSDARGTINPQFILPGVILVVGVVLAGVMVYLKSR